MENTSTNSSPATLGRQSLEYNDQFERFYTDPEASHVSQQLYQDNRHQRTISCVCNELAELSEVFNYHYNRLRKYVAELRGWRTAQRESLNHPPLAVEDAANCSQPLSASPSGALKYPDSCSTHEECSNLLQQDETISKMRLENNYLE